MITVSKMFCLQKPLTTGLNMLYCNHISRMWSWECFPLFHEEIFNQGPGILSMRIQLLRLSQPVRNSAWCSGERRHLKYQMIVFQEAVSLFVQKNPQKPHRNPLSLCLGGGEVGFYFKQASETKRLETSAGKLMYNFSRKVRFDFLPRLKLHVWRLYDMPCIYRGFIMQRQDNLRQ